MFTVSDKYKRACKALGRQKDTVISYKNEETGEVFEFRPQNVEYSFSGRMFQTCMAYINVDFKGEVNIHEKVVTLKNGFFIDGEFEYINYGDFLVKDIEQNVEKGTTKFTCYDKMLGFMKQYQKPKLEYPCTLLDLIKSICAVCNAQLYHEDIFNKDLEISMDYYDGLDVTYRDVLDQIAQATGSTIFIKEGKLYFSGVNSTGEILGSDVLKSIKIGEYLKAVSSLVLSREPQEDNVYAQDVELIEISGLSEIRFVNNELIDKRRELVVESLFERIKGTEYYTFETEDIGLCYFEPCDKVILEDLSGSRYEATILNINLKLSSGMEQVLSAQISQSTTQYKYATTAEKRLKNTEIIVDKQKGEIKSIVEDTEENFTNIYQTLSNINYDVQAAGGVNLIRNSVMFLETNNKPTHWIIEGTGLRIQSSPDGINSGCVSGNEFVLTDTLAKQTVSNLKVDSADILEKDKLYYSLGVRIKKSLGAVATIKIFGGTPEIGKVSDGNDGGPLYDEHVITIPEDKEYNYELVEISGFLPMYDSYTLELGSQGETAFTDVILCQGKNAKSWTQANGEYMNTNVTIDTDGIKVKSNVYQGDYTIMSPLEFAGYSKAGGSLEKTFYLQRDETHSKKLKIIESITVGNYTILPIDTGNLHGIVFI